MSTRLLIVTEICLRLKKEKPTSDGLLTLSGRGDTVVSSSNDRLTQDGEKVKQKYSREMDTVAALERQIIRIYSSDTKVEDILSDLQWLADQAVSGTGADYSGMKYTLSQFSSIRRSQMLMHTIFTQQFDVLSYDP